MRHEEDSEGQVCNEHRGKDDQQPCSSKGCGTLEVVPLGSGDPFKEPFAG